MSYLDNLDPNALDNLYKNYVKDPNSVDIHWKRFFEGFDFANTNFSSDDKTIKSIKSIKSDKNIDLIHINKEAAVFSLIQEYRSRGHLFAKTNPIRRRRIYSPPISIDRFNLDDQDLNKVFQIGSEIGLNNATLKEIINHLEATYCGAIGCEYKIIRMPNALSWVTKRLEQNKNQPSFNKKAKLKILDVLSKAVLFEQFMHTRFVGQKRFSLEGLEALIPALQTVIEHGSSTGIKEFVFGMAHRGRLNVLGNIFQKDYAKIFSEFDAKGYSGKNFVGDVKYHMGFSSDITLTKGEKVHLNILSNPSHLEAVNPVVMGATRAKIDQRYKADKNKIVSILIHGDASIAGQGIIYEQMQMMQLPAYSTGGMVHIVINNQLGFTTNYAEARTSTYCTDVAKVGLCPVFHVNGDDIEAVVHTVLIALEFRQLFNRDVFIDILGYRRYGHNEGDDPKFTQAILYGLIQKHPNPFDIYADKLLKEGTIDEEYKDKLKTKFWDMLEGKLASSKKSSAVELNSYLEGDWQSIRMPSSGELCKSPKTSIKEKVLTKILEKITSLPEDRNFIKKAKNILSQKRTAFFTEDKIDWSTAEALSMGSLLLDGYHVRFSGQDVTRGTFSQRHAMFRSADELVDYYPLKNLSDKQGQFMIFNSLLSEYAVLGFEYGYALASPNTLTLWEAQFGDFANGAQIMIDQLIVSAETKWQKMNGIVLLLPHAQEGQGPEHSSGRLERFLQLCASENIIVANVSTPANYFHLLRRQMLYSFRKPLIVFTPKSLLRHPLCVSSKQEFCGNHSFKGIIDDHLINKKKVTKALLCSGKVYYDLLDYRSTNKIKNTAIIRIEQLYPFDSAGLNQIIATYPGLKKIVWTQEEPARQGAMMFVDWFWKNKKMPLEFVSRKESSTTASGFITIYKKEQATLLAEAFAN